MISGMPVIRKCSKCGSTNYGYTADMRLCCRNCGHEQGAPKNNWESDKKATIYEYKHEAVREF